MKKLFKEKKIVLSVEIFPPKAEANVANTLESAQAIWALNPDYISITRGAGGSTLGMDSVAIADKMTNKYGIVTLAHLTCINTDKKNIDILLDRLESAGVKSILALRGDLTPQTENLKRDFHYATDLIKHIKERAHFDICAACYPEGHTESSGFEEDLFVMKAKSELGVTHLITQLFFDNNVFYNMLEQMYKHNITTPVQAGIMPLTNVNILNKIVRLSGAKIPKTLADIIMQYQDKPESLFAAGVDYACLQMDELISAGARGIHLYAMNNVRLATLVANNIYAKVSKINATAKRR